MLPVASSTAMSFHIHAYMWKTQGHSGQRASGCQHWASDTGGWATFGFAGCTYTCLDKTSVPDRVGLLLHHHPTAPTHHPPDRCRHECEHPQALLRRSYILPDDEMQLATSILPWSSTGGTGQRRPFRGPTSWLA